MFSGEIGRAETPPFCSCSLKFAFQLCYNDNTATFRYTLFIVSDYRLYFGNKRYSNLLYKYCMNVCSIYQLQIWDRVRCFYWVLPKSILYSHVYSVVLLFIQSRLLVAYVHVCSMFILNKHLTSQRCFDFRRLNNVTWALVIRQMFIVHLGT